MGVSYANAKEVREYQLHWFRSICCGRYAIAVPAVAIHTVWANKHPVITCRLHSLSHCFVAVRLIQASCITALCLCSVFAMPIPCHLLSYQKDVAARKIYPPTPEADTSERQDSCMKQEGSDQHNSPKSQALWYLSWFCIACKMSHTTQNCVV